MKGIEEISKMGTKQILLEGSVEKLSEIVSLIGDDDKYNKMAGFIQAMIDEIADDKPNKEWLLGLVDQYSFCKGLGKVETEDKTSILSKFKNLYDNLYTYIKKLK